MAFDPEKRQALLAAAWDQLEARDQSTDRTVTIELLDGDRVVVVQTVTVAAGGMIPLPTPPAGQAWTGWRIVSA